MCFISLVVALFSVILNNRIMLEQILLDLNEVGYLVNSLKHRISSVLHQAEILLGDSHVPPHDIGSKNIAHAKSGAVCQYHKRQENISTASTILASTTQSL